MHYLILGNVLYFSQVETNYRMYNKVYASFLLLFPYYGGQTILYGKEDDNFWIQFCLIVPLNRT